MADNFEAVDLSWVKNITDPLVVLRQGLDFLEDPSKISNDNREKWCNLHVYSCPPGLRNGGAYLGGGRILHQEGVIGV